VHGILVFDLRAYSAKDASLTLVSGKVGLKDNLTGERLKVAPDEQAVWSKDNGFDLSTVDTYPLTQWKDGYFYFNNEPMVKIMQELGRWYNVNVVFEEQSDMNIKLHFVAERNQTIEKILEGISALDVVKVEYKDNTITVK